MSMLILSISEWFSWRKERDVLMEQLESAKNRILYMSRESHIAYQTIKLYGNELRLAHAALRRKGKALKLLHKQLRDKKVRP